jgi:hypothetical protein
MEEVERLYAEAESATAKAMEELVARDSFGTLLVRVTENTMGIAKLTGGALDMVLRNLRIAGRQDITRLARQIARTEDKLEMLLQEVERLGAQLDAARAADGEDGVAPGEPHGNGNAAPRKPPARRKRAAPEG